LTPGRCADLEDKHIARPGPIYPTTRSIGVHRGENGGAMEVAIKQPPVIRNKSGMKVRRHGQT
jgi:hypothetical protein